MTPFLHFLLIGLGGCAGLLLILGGVTALALCRASAQRDALSPAPESRVTPLGSARPPYPSARDWRRL